jgi:rhodanese-related sulfurtransferase
MIEMLSARALSAEPNHLVVDVRSADEVAADPIAGAINIPLPELLGRLDELPRDRRLAFVCAGNVRSVKAAEYLSGALGWDNVCVLDKFSL